MQHQQLFANTALLPSGWAHNVLLTWDAQGVLTAVASNVPCPPGVERVAGPLLPGMPNLHSHAFQRAMAGLTEARGAGQDSFWSWRDLMYRFANCITPEQLEAIATVLYVEMLEAGYTSVCEFHYVHHAQNGQAYAEDATMAHSLIRAAKASGIGLTLLPVLYQSSGFGALPPREDQRRFVRSTANMLALLDQLAPLCRTQGVRLGLAPHSLRAVPPESLQEAVAGLKSLDASAPIHIHIAEQTAEVDACLAWSGQRPVQWLLNHVPVDAHWCLVHATHLSDEESQAAAQTGAVAGLCPSTEANLGDGIFKLPQWSAAGGLWGIGSDSHICVNAAEELMLLEYSQRLALRQRNVLTTPQHPDVASAMLQAAVRGGAQASGQRVAGLAIGQRADAVALDPIHPVLAGMTSAPAQLSAHVFASQRQSAIASVWVAGQQRVDNGRHTSQHMAHQGLARVQRELQQAAVG